MQESTLCQNFISEAKKRFATWDTVSLSWEVASDGTCCRLEILPHHEGDLNVLIEVRPDQITIRSPLFEPLIFQANGDEKALAHSVVTYLQSLKRGCDWNKTDKLCQQCRRSLATVHLSEFTGPTENVESNDTQCIDWDTERCIHLCEPCSKTFKWPEMGSPA